MKAYDSVPVERPGCVTIYAILYWLVAAVYIIVAMIGGASLISDSIGGSVVLLICGLLLSAIPIGIGIGLWQMKKWAWALVVVIQYCDYCYSDAVGAADWRGVFPDRGGVRHTHALNKRAI